jgi:general secretion pathway protein A
MYQRFFGLREDPFNVNPDPRYLFATQRVRESLAGLIHGIRSRKGFILLTGEVGTGKTTLLNQLADWLHGEQVATACIFNSLLTPNHMLDLIVEDLGIPCESREKSQILMRLNNSLLEQYRAGRTAVVIIDDAENLSCEVLEEIRLLTNLETSTEKLLQVVLCGHPELEEKLKLPHMRQLRQRITLRCYTSPLTLKETFGYVGERLRIAGAKGQPVFSNEAIELVHRYSHGVPRLINLLCEHSMIGAYVDHLRPVPARLVEEVVGEFQLDELDSTSPRPSQGHAENAQSIQAFIDNLRDHVALFDQNFLNPNLSPMKGTHESHP